MYLYPPNQLGLLRFCTASAIAVLLTVTWFLPTFAQASPQRLDPVSTLPIIGNYCVAQQGISLHDAPYEGSMSLNVDGVPVRSYWFWTGRSEYSPVGDNTINVTVDNATGIRDVTLEAQDVRSGQDDIYTWHSNGYRDDNLEHVTTGLNQYAVSGLSINGNAAFNHGVAVIVIYEAPTCPYTQINGWFGLDSFHWTRKPPLGPDSGVLCERFPSSTEPRSLDFSMAIGGVASSVRGNSIWTMTGTGTLPTTLVPNKSNVPVPGAMEIFDPLNGDPGHEWDFATAEITIPAGDTFACLQIESPEDDNGISAVWSGLVTSMPLEPPAIEISKSAEPPLIRSGESVTFTIQVTNTGATPLTNVVISDALAPGCNAAFSSLAPGDGEQFQCTLDALLTSFTNSADVTGTPPTGFPVTDRDDAAVDVYTPAIAIEKGPNDQSISPRETVTFTITVRNIGDIALTNVTITDPVAPDCDRNWPEPLPPLAEFSYQCRLASVSENLVNVATVTGEPPSGLPVTASDDAAVRIVIPPSGTDLPSISINKTPDAQQIQIGQGVTFTIQVTNTGDLLLVDLTITDPQTPACARTLPSLAPGESFSYACTLAEVTADFVNVAAVTATTLNGDRVTDSDDASVTVIPLPSTSGTAAIAITKSAVDEGVLVGTPGVFTIQVENIGDVTLFNVVVTDPLVPDCNISLPQLAPTQLHEYTCQTNQLFAPLTNGVLVVGQTAEGDNVQDDDTARIVPVTPAVEIDKSPDQQSIVSGDTAFFTITVFNRGEVALQQITVADPIAPDCIRTFAQLPIGASTSYRCEMPSVQAPVTNTAIVTATPLISITTGSLPDFLPTVTDRDNAMVTISAPAAIGDRVWLDLNLNGQQDAGEPGMANVTVTLYQGADLLETTKTDRNGAYLFEDLAPGAYAVDFELPSGYAFTRPNVGSDISDSDVATDTGLSGTIELTEGDTNRSVDAGLTGSPQLLLSKTDDGQMAQPGAVVAYTLVVTNAGSVAALDVVITELLPNFTRYEVEGSDQAWLCGESDAISVECTYTVGTLDAGEVVEIRFALRINAPLPLEIRFIENQATVTSTNGLSGNNSATTRTPLIPTALDLTGEPSDLRFIFVPLIH